MNEESLRKALRAMAGETSPQPGTSGAVSSLAARRARRRRVVAGTAIAAFVLGAAGLLRYEQESTVRTVPAAPSTGLTVVAVTPSGAIRVLDVATGRTVRTLVTQGANGGIARSPDGTTLYYADAGTGCASGTVLSVPVDGATPPKEVARGTRPVVSPDGTRLAYWTRQEGDTGCDLSVVVRVLATGTEQRWTLGNGYFRRGPLRRLDWSPDGRRLLFARGDDNGPPILDITAPGPLERRREPIEPFGTALAWHPRPSDGGRIAMLTSDTGGVSSNVHVALVDPESGEFEPAYPNVRPVMLDFDASGANLVWVDAEGRLHVSDASGRTRSLGSGYLEASW